MVSLHCREVLINKDFFPIRKKKERKKRDFWRERGRIGITKNKQKTTLLLVGGLFPTTKKYIFKSNLSVFSFSFFGSFFLLLLLEHILVVKGERFFPGGSLCFIFLFVFFFLSSWLCLSLVQTHDNQKVTVVRVPQFFWGGGGFLFLFLIFYFFNFRI